MVSPQSLECSHSSTEMTFNTFNQNNKCAIHISCMGESSSTYHRLQMSISEILILNIPVLFFCFQLESSEEKKPEEEEERQDLNIIPPFSEKYPDMESRARGSHRGAAAKPGTGLPLLLWLLTLWSLHLGPQ